MIAELSAALAAIKETASLAKAINDAKTDAEIKAATVELQSKLLSLQSDCFSLGDVIRGKEELVAQLRSKLAEIDDFKQSSVGYVLTKTAAGTMVYSKNASNEEFVINACPQCFMNNQLSMLQPSPKNHSMGGYFIHYCPSCKSEFKMDEVPPIEPVQMTRRTARRI
ncbi:hypothetical protein [Kluyvera sp. CRP]|uniref:hypothetical protein n=1 Tax=Kluyvera sp. CRP TaxID=2873269 RepID=UPI001CC20AA9|nr:hypothetical protein [Kluyvera sp. CRP]